MQRDNLYLSDIIEASDAIARFLGGVKESGFAGNDLLRSAVLQKLVVIGEAAKRVGRGVQERHPEVPWSDIVAFRNIAVHAYFSVNWSTVWITATEEVPALKTQITNILNQLESGDD